MERGWRANIRKVTPYVPGEQPQETGILKLNTNENPYPPAPGVERCLKELKAEALRLYPNTDALPIVEALAERFHLEKSHFFVGVGSDDVLATAFLTFFNGENPVLFPDITYSFYEVWASLYGIPFLRPALKEDFHIKKEDYLGEYLGKRKGGIVLANPNAPTGIYEPISLIEDIVRANSDLVVIVDEAYVDFAEESAVRLTEKYDNLLVVQTFSKSRSLAGMRIGYAIGSPELIAAMNTVKFSYNSYTMNLPAQICGAEAIRDEAYFRKNVERIVKTREWTGKRLREMGFDFPESGTNFLFVTHPKVSAEWLLEELKKRKIYVRHFKQPRIKDYLRVTIGTEEQMDVFIKNLTDVIE